eukprot:TRINITY_DN18037_c0_g1_i1.p1 TRINITY_DN18037_c0_g1~~TRINITY_DN18037_c0_g1_i1.p1  ORF type:complete len:570 (-),score=59.42 TRINITY_DN18037_c0_g1_i1:2300-4009(-)
MIRRGEENSRKESCQEDSKGSFVPIFSSHTAVRLHHFSFLLFLLLCVSSTEATNFVRKGGACSHARCHNLVIASIYHDKVTQRLDGFAVNGVRESGNVNFEPFALDSDGYLLHSESYRLGSSPWSRSRAGSATPLPQTFPTPPAAASDCCSACSQLASCNVWQFFDEDEWSDESRLPMVAGKRARCLLYKRWNQEQDPNVGAPPKDYTGQVGRTWLGGWCNDSSSFSTKDRRKGPTGSRSSHIRAAFTRNAQRLESQSLPLGGTDVGVTSVVPNSLQTANSANAFDDDSDPSRVGRSFCLLTDHNLHVNMLIDGVLEQQLQRQYQQQQRQQQQYKPRTLLEQQQELSLEGGAISPLAGNGGKALRSWLRELGVIFSKDGEEHQLRLSARRGPSAERGNGFLAEIEMDSDRYEIPVLGESLELGGGMTLSFQAQEKKGVYDVDAFVLNVPGVVEMEVKLRPAHQLLRTEEEAFVHFNIAFTKLDPSADVHGVLGQTFREDPTREERYVKYSAINRLLGHSIAGDEAAGHELLAGEVDDYISSSVLAPDCFFTAYKSAGTTRYTAQTTASL